MAEMTEKERYSVTVYAASALNMSGGFTVKEKEDNETEPIMDVVIPWWMSAKQRTEIKRKLSRSKLINVYEEPFSKNWCMSVLPVAIAFAIIFSILKYCFAYSTAVAVFVSAVASLILFCDGDGIHKVMAILSLIRIIHEVVLKLKQGYDAVMRFRNGDFSGPWFTVGSTTAAI